MKQILSLDHEHFQWMRNVLDHRGRRRVQLDVLIAALVDHCSNVVLPTSSRDRGLADRPLCRVRHSRKSVLEKRARHIHFVLFSAHDELSASFFLLELFLADSLAVGVRIRFLLNVVHIFNLRLHGSGTSLQLRRAARVVQPLGMLSLAYVKER